MKRFLRLTIAVMLAAALAFSLAGCKKAAEETKETKAEEPEAKTGKMEGTLVSFSGKDLTIKSNGKEYTFDIFKATVKASGMLAGDEIVVHYKGEITEADGTSKVTVTSIEDKGNKTKKKEEAKQAVGTLVKITENTITIRQNDGKELTFNSNNCQHEFKNGIREGNWIIVTYLGEIKGTDTKNVKVIKITDNDPNVVKEEQKKMNIKAVDETVYCTADSVHIRKSYTTDSEIVGALGKGESIQRTGICDNGWSRVVFGGADAYVYGDYLTTTAPAQDAPPATTKGEPVETPAPPQEPQAEPVEIQQTIEGTVVEVSMNTLTFSANGQNYTVYIADAAHNYQNGIQTGNAVTVVYTGNLADIGSVTVISVTDTDPNTAAQNAVYTGTVLDATMNTVTIRTDDGVEMTFLKEGATDNTGGIMVDMRVSITADASAADQNSNIMPAKQIDPAA